MWKPKTLIRLGWSESSLGAHIILLVLSWGGSFAWWTLLYFKTVDLRDVWCINVILYSILYANITRRLIRFYAVCLSTKGLNQNITFQFYSNIYICVKTHGGYVHNNCCQFYGHRRLWSYRMGAHTYLSLLCTNMWFSCFGSFIRSLECLVK